MSETPLDAAVLAFANSDADRLKFFERFAEAELFLLLESEATEAVIDPLTFEVEGGKLLAVFDRVERLTSFTGTSSPYAALSGRNLAQMLEEAEDEVGVVLNLGVEGGEMVLDPQMLAWLSQTLRDDAHEMNANVVEVSPPKGVPETLITALDTKLAQAQGLAQAAVLVGATYDTGAKGFLLAVLDVVPGAEGALTQAVNEALTFSGLDAAALDVTFLPSTASQVEAIVSQGLRFDLPSLAMPEPPKAPGMDPDKPPRLN